MAYALVESLLERLCIDEAPVIVKLAFRQGKVVPSIDNTHACSVSEIVVCFIFLAEEVQCQGVIEKPNARWCPQLGIAVAKISGCLKYDLRLRRAAMMPEKQMLKLDNGSKVAFMFKCLEENMLSL